MGRIRPLGLVAALLVAFVVPGCSIPTACPAISWFNTFSIHLDGNVANVAILEVCLDGECATSAPLPPETEELATAVPTHPAALLPFSISRVDERNWTASIGMTTPDTVTLRALSSTGQVLAEREAPLEWRRVGGSEQCGGPGEAGPATLEIPS